jgi:membrane-anchored mycosin MYCP
VVAVIDDGFDLNHPALRDNLWHMPGRPDVHGRDFIGRGDDPSPVVEVPVSSHGTMVAGIIGGRPDRAGSFAGVAPNVALMPLRWRSSHPPEAHANPVHMAAALRFAITHGARIVNLSAGIDTTRKSARALAELLSAFKLAETRNVLIVVAAPNMPENMDAVTDWLPGVYPFTNIIHVTGLCRELRLLGAWGKRSVDIAAPAEDIIGPTAGGGYRSGCATSFAAPLVTGALALVWGLLPSLRANQVRRLILRKATRTGQQDHLEDTPKPCRAKEHPSAEVWRLRPHEVWGHEFPATPEGRLDLGFVEEACERYWDSRGFPGFFRAGAPK